MVHAIHTRHSGARVDAVRAEDATPAADAAVLYQGQHATRNRTNSKRARLTAGLPSRWLFCGSALLSASGFAGANGIAFSQAFGRLGTDTHLDFIHKLAQCQKLIQSAGSLAAPLYNYI